MMHTKTKHHDWHYIMLIAIFALGLALVYAAKESQYMQSLYVIMTAILFFTWSMVHHAVHHQLHVKTVIEYALFATLGVVLTFFLLTM